MAIGFAHRKKMNRENGNRERKDKNNGKGRLKLRIVGEDDKHTNEEVVGKTILTFDKIVSGDKFELAVRPEGVEGDPPVFQRIEDKDGVHRVHNCKNLDNNRTMWMPATIQVIVVDQ